MPIQRGCRRRRHQSCQGFLIFALNSGIVTEEMNLTINRRRNDKIHSKLPEHLFTLFGFFSSLVGVERSRIDNIVDSTATPAH